MGIDDLFNKAKGALDSHEDEAKAALDKAADFVKGKTDDAGDAKVDEVVDKAKEFHDKE